MLTFAKNKTSLFFFFFYREITCEFCHRNILQQIFPEPGFVTMPRISCTIGLTRAKPADRFVPDVPSALVIDTKKNGSHVLFSSYKGVSVQCSPAADCDALCQEVGCATGEFGGGGHFLPPGHPPGHPPGLLSMSFDVGGCWKV